MTTTSAPFPPTNVPLSTGPAAMLNGAKKFIGAVEDEWQLYSDRASDYVIGAPIGFGASSIVYTATYCPTAADNDGSAKASGAEGIPCALKVLDLDSLPPRSLHLLQRETTLMSLSKHPNVLRVRGSWMDGHKLYIALRLMNKGSAADVMRYGWPGGMEEDVCRCILRQALQGLNYLHINGFIHRDVKAANLLIDDDGTVLLGDLGVAADLSEDNTQFHTSSRSQRVSASVALSTATISPVTTRKSVDDGHATAPRPRVGKRKSFVGTPCWMAPELIQGRQYDASADIWSFGITALELTQGRPPRSRESPQKVLLKTIQEDPPALERDGGAFKYSRAFKEVIDSCLVKDPTQRPTAAELLQTPFFKASKPKQYLINTILKGLPPLVQRQERRIVAKSMHSANSVDSWDFSTVNSPLSPTTSVFRRTVLQNWVSAQEAEEIKEWEGEQEEEPRVLKAVTRSNENPEMVETSNNASESEPEPEVVLSSSPTSSDSSVLASSVAGTSAPSSYCEPSELERRTKAVKEENLVAIPEHGSPSSGSLHRTISAIPGSTTPRQKPNFTPDNATPQANSPGLWKKLKANVRRPGSRDGTPSKERSIGAMIESASKGFLGSSTSMKSLTRHASRS